MTTKRPKKNSGNGSRPVAAKRGVAAGRGSKKNGHSRPDSASKSLPGSRLAEASSTRRGIDVAQMPIDERHVAAVRGFESALHFEQRQNYGKAREVLEKLVATAPADVADRARVHLRACLERLGANTPTPKTAADFHVLGVAELNARDLDLAVEHLTKAQKLDPEREEIRYALAAAHALKGDADEALAQLETAINLRPQNRFQARRDADFETLASDPRFVSLVNQEVTASRRSA